jgi:hypothetical protein
MAKIVNSTLIIREVYFGGGPAVDGGNYTSDQYIEIYNNSDDVIYLDSLFIGTVAPSNGRGVNAWANSDLRPMPNYQFMVPGDGTTYPLAPGEGATFAFNAVDHTPVSQSRLRLSRAHFAIHHPTYTHASVSAPDPSVVTLLRVTELGFGDNRPTAYTMSVTSPTIVIYRIPNLEEYLDNLPAWRFPEPGRPTTNPYWHIHKDWIINGIDIVEGGENTTKRLPEDVDASFVIMKGGNSQGNVVTRRIDRTLPGGRIIYQDTESSADDFVTAKPNPRLRP